MLNEGADNADEVADNAAILACFFNCLAWSQSEYKIEGLVWTKVEHYSI